MATSTIEVNPNTLDATNLKEEAPGIWSAITIEPDTIPHLQAVLTVQLQKDPTLLSECTNEITTLKQAGIMDEDMTILKGFCIFPNRCIIIKLSIGGVLVYSPSKILDGMKEFINREGGVKAVIPAHIFNLEEWERTWPESYWYATSSLIRAPKARKDCEMIPDPKKKYKCDISTERGRLLLGEEVEVYGIPVGDNRYEHSVYHKPTGTLLSADRIYNGDVGGDFEVGGIGWSTTDPIALAVRSLWYKAQFRRWNLPSPHLPVYQVLPTSNGFMRYVTGGMSCLDYEEVVGFFVEGFKDCRDTVAAIDAICELPLQRIITCHCKKNPIGEDCKVILKRAWEFARRLDGKKCVVDMGAWGTRTVQDFVTNLTTVEHPTWAPALLRNKMKIVPCDVNSTSLPLDTVLNTLEGTDWKFALVDA